MSKVNCLTLSVEQLIEILDESGICGNNIMTVTLDELNNDIHIYYEGDPGACQHAKTYLTGEAKEKSFPWKCELCGGTGVDSFIEPTTHWTSSTMEPLEDEDDDEDWDDEEDY